MNTADSAVLPGMDEVALRKLGRMYRLSRIRYLLLLLIPAFWLLGGFLISLGGTMDGLAAGVLIAWFFVTLFGVAGWVYLVISPKEEVKRKYVSHVLPFLFRNAGLEVDYYPSHDLSMATFLRSGLFHEDYQTMLREDCVQGTAGRMPFSMYQVAVQTVSGVYGRYGNSARVATNQFYGWAIHCIIPPITGTHVILSRKRKTFGEADDWLKKTTRNWEHNPKTGPLLTGYEPFDAHYIVYSNNPQSFFSFASKEFLEFLIFLRETSPNAPGFNISGTLFSVHIGHNSPTFRHCPDGDFATTFHPEIIEEVTWFAQLIKGIQKFTNSKIQNVSR